MSSLAPEESLPALFRAYPALRARIPRFALLPMATPVGPLHVDALLGQPIYVKRDDRSCPEYGGNKPRKLEFILGAARARGARRLVTTGGLGTHHGLATTILGARAGLATSLVLVDQPVTDEVRESLLLDVAYGAELLYGKNVAGAVAQTARVLARATLAGERPQLVPTGGSSARGNLGFVSAGLELLEQVRAGEIPAPSEIQVPVGSGGTMVGLVVALRISGLDTRVRGVLVSDILPPSPRRLAAAARATLRLLRRHDASIPHVAISPAEFPLDRTQLGAGYGAPTPAAEEAVRVAAQAGLALETTYGAKCFAALLVQARQPGGIKAPVLFWHTYNGVDVRPGAPRSLDTALLPPAFRRILAAGPE